LAGAVAQAAADPCMAERRRLWYLHAACQGERPMILAETMGVLPELLPESVLTCESTMARRLELYFRDLLFRHHQVADDYVIEPWFNVNWQVDLGSYGVTAEKTRGDNAGKLGSYVWDAPIKDLDRDFDLLHPRQFSVDREGTLALQAEIEALLGDILPVRIRGMFYWTMGMTWTAIDLIGLQNLMLVMYDNPSGLHRLMAFLRDDHLALIDWLEAEGLYTLNNEDDYIGSGSIGYTHELPQKDWQPGERVRAKDLWVLSESQETVGVSPKLFAKFVLPYQLPLIARFGLCYYGCCEPVHTRATLLRQIPNLRRLSVSPWCDQAYVAEHLPDDVILCRKPNPALISRATWDEEAIRADIAESLHLMRGRTIEFAMKDVHTLADQPWRLGRWVELAREEIEAAQ
jgi:hypothetical protein